jgi:hypothetical protein
MTSSPNPTADAEEWLEKYIQSWIPINVKDAQHVKQAKLEARREFLNHITTNYVPREQIEKIIGEDEEINHCDSDWYLIETSRQMGALKPHHLKTMRNAFRAEQRKRLAALHPNQSTSKEKQS